MIQSAGMVLRSGTALLAQSLGEGAASDARILMAEVLGVPRDRLTLELSRLLTPQDVARFEFLIKRRAAFEPISQIIGRREFWGRDFHVTGEVLDPRPETESLIAEALKGPVPNRVLDLGVGSGCILLTLLAEWGSATGVGVDASQAALDIAGQNADSLGVADRVELRQGDWLKGIVGPFDLIVSNPPYISKAEMSTLDPDVANWEPHQALCPGDSGLESYAAIIPDLPNEMTADGRVLFEIGPTQAQAASEMLRDAGFKQISVVKDMDGRDRVVSGTI